jgi:hypothetical protein
MSVAKKYFTATFPLDKSTFSGGNLLPILAVLDGAREVRNWFWEEKPTAD